MFVRCLTILLTLGLQAVHGDPSERPLPPGVSRHQLIVTDLHPQAQVNLHGIILIGGESEHFSPPPEFALFKGSKWDPDNGVGYPASATLKSLELPNERRYPLQIRDLESPTIFGPAVIGLQSRQLPWRVVKAMWDGDAMHIKHCTGTAEVSDVYFENVEDGLGPMEGLSYWKLDRAWMKDIRDDAVENDDLINGEISNCLIDGCFVFLSHQGAPDNGSKPTTVVRNCLVRISAQPHDGSEERSWRRRNIKPGEDGMGVAPGMIFKWEGDAGTVEVRETIFFMDAISINGVDAMAFPPGIYENVTLIWTGPGNYPQPLPRGVTQVHDPSIWTRAKEAWIEAAPENHPGLHLPDLP